MKVIEALGLKVGRADRMPQRAVPTFPSPVLRTPSPHRMKGQRMNRGASKSDFLSVSVSVRLALACVISTLAESTHGQSLLLLEQAAEKRNPDKAAQFYAK